MKGYGSANRRICVEPLERRLCLAASVGWDGPGLGSAALTYYVASVPSTMELSQQEVEAGLEMALSAWASVADITFTRTDLPRRHNSIDFEFSSIDGSGGTLAQAYYPDDANREPIAGDVEFDTSEGWEIGNSQGGSAFDLVFVAVHEIGHSLGLEHTEAIGSVMRPTISPSQTFDGFGQSDIDAIQALYAPGTAISLTTLGVDQKVISENEIVTLSGSFFDAEGDGGHVVTIDWGDGSAETLATVDEFASTFEADHRYLDGGEIGTEAADYTITVRIEDLDTGNVDSGTTYVTVENIAPRLTGLFVTTAEEGSSSTLTGFIHDPGSLDTFTVEVDWGDGSAEETFTCPAGTTEFSETHVYVDDPGGTFDDEYTLTITVTDDDQGSYIGLAEATVLNAAPTVTIVDAPTSGWLGQRIALQTKVIDPGVEDIHSYHWEVTHDGLRYTEGDGADYAFVPTRDGVYGLTVTVADGDGGTDSTMARIVVDGDLGTVDFLTVESLTLPDRQLHLVLTTVRSGTLTLETLAAETTEDVSIAVYDQNPLEDDGISPLAVSTPSDGNQRIDLPTPALQSYYVQLEGTSLDFDFRIANLVQVQGDFVSVYGTDGDDDFLFSASTGRQIVINEVSYEFSEEQAWEIEFDGVEGYDRAILRDSPGDESLEAWPAAAVLNNSGDDGVTDFTVSVHAFEEMHAYANRDGHDTATLHDSEVNDKFKAEPAEDYAKMYGGALYNRVKFFDVVDAHSGGGSDLARVFDTSGDDVFEGQRDTSRLSGTGFDVRVHDFRYVIAYASEGTDTATFVDSALRDEFHAKPWKSELFDIAGDIYTITARRFDSVRAEATNSEGDDEDGGLDIAKIWPSAADDLVEASDEWFRFYVQDGTLELLYEVVAFETVRVRETTEEGDAADVVDPLAYDLILEDGWE